MTNLIMESLFPHFCIFSDNIEQFYELTIKEILVFIESRSKHITTMSLNQAQLNYLNTDHLSAVLSRLISGKGNIPRFEVLYKHLVSDDVAKLIEERKAKSDLEKIKANMLKFVETHKRKGGLNG